MIALYHWVQKSECLLRKEEKAFDRMLIHALRPRIPVNIKPTFTRDRICSDPFENGSTMVRIHLDYTGLVRNWNGIVPYGFTFISGPIWYQMQIQSVLDPPRVDRLGGDTCSYVFPQTWLT